MHDLSPPMRIACHRDFGPPGVLVRGTKFPRGIGPRDHLLRNCALDELVRDGDNGPVQILGSFSGKQSKDTF